MQNKHFLLLKNVKNTESAQLCSIIKQDGSAFSESMAFISNHFNIFCSYSNSQEV